MGNKVGTVQASQLVLYWFPMSAPCRAVLMLCRELGLSTELRVVDLMKGDQLKDDFQLISPMHTVPVIDDGGLRLWESRAILQYLVNKYGAKKADALYPREAAARARVDLMLNISLSTVNKAIVEYMRPQLFQKKPADPEKETKVKEALQFLEKTLQANQYLTGNHMTIADLCMVTDVSMLEPIAYNLASYPSLVAWIGRMKQLTYYGECNQGLEDFKKSMQ
ncbi:glutathione S-transferase 1-like [Lethenteron reissneri]|uniref:glutathione S-transferase 1-like n=1 Tax=Lethenteron reissneri TaxID=7753 RepID=UPI002AB67C99|nr:glutathione S-transferase 1-like [Lethenteron reissneri]